MKEGTLVVKRRGFLKTSIFFTVSFCKYKLIWDQQKNGKCKPQNSGVQVNFTGARWGFGIWMKCTSFTSSRGGNDGQYSLQSSASWEYYIIWDKAVTVWAAVPGTAAVRQQELSHGTLVMVWLMFPGCQWSWVWRTWMVLQHNTASESHSAAAQMERLEGIKQALFLWRLRRSP